MSYEQRLGFGAPTEIKRRSYDLIEAQDFYWQRKHCLHSVTRYTDLRGQFKNAQKEISTKYK